MTLVMKRTKIRLDQILVERGLADSREKARALILAGQVTVEGQKSDKPGHGIADDARVEVLERMPYVSRGGLKLAAALDHFSIGAAGESRLTWAHRLEDLRIACCSAARRAFGRWTWVTASSTGGCATILAWWCAKV